MLRLFACWPLRTPASGFAILLDGRPFVENARFRGLPQREDLLREAARLGPEVPVTAVRLEQLAPPLDVLIEREPASGAVLVVVGVAAAATEHRLSNALFALRLRAEALRRRGSGDAADLEALRRARAEVAALLEELTLRTAGSRSW